MRTALALAAALTLPACMATTAPEVARFDGSRVTLHAPAAPTPTRATDDTAAALCGTEGKVARYAWTDPAAGAGFDHLYLCF